MSGALKKIGKAIKKTFSKVVKTVKKIVKSDIFKVIAVAAAIYFTAGAVAGMMPAAGAVGVGGLAPVTVPAMALKGTAATVAGAMSAGVGAAGSGGILSTLGAAVKGVTAGQASLASGVVSTVGSGMSAYAKGEAAKELEKEKEREKDERRKNSETALDVAGSFNASQEKRDFALKTDAQGSSVYNSPIANLSNVEDKSGDMSYYNNATNSYDTAKQKKATA